MRRWMTFLAASALGVGLLAGSAGAAPIGAKKAFLLQTSCGAVVLNNANGNSDNTNALWAPAHFVGSNKVFTPSTLSYTATLTAGGQTQTQTVNVAKNPPKGSPLTTCSFDQTEVSPDGTFHIVGSATGVIH